jgi:putative hemolysin
MEIIILLALIFLNGLFVMSEIALVSARKSWLENQADKGNEAARVALELANNPEIFLSAAQIGITAISIITGVYSGEKFGHYLQPTLEKIQFLKPYAGTIATTIIVILVTFLSIIFGELIPKRTGLIRAEKIATLVALPVLYFAKATHPIVWLLNKVSNIYFQIINIKPDKDSNVTEEEIKAIISEGTEQGTIEEAEQEIIERVFHLSDRNITSLMTHRSEIVWFDLHDNEDVLHNKIHEGPHSVYPVCEEGLDHIKGIVSLKDLYLTNNITSFDSILRPAIFVPENITAYKLLEKFKAQRLSCCFIVDEYGSLEGMITITDILEAILGELPQPDEETYEIVKRDDGSYLTDAQIPFYDFLSYFQRADWMNEGGHEFDTLAGFILHQLERIPHTGDQLTWRAFTFEIIDMDAQRIDKVLVTISDTIREEMEEEE